MKPLTWLLVVMICGCTSSLIEEEEVAELECVKNRLTINESCIVELGLQNEFASFDNAARRMIVDFDINSSITIKVATKPSEFGDPAWVERFDYDDPLPDSPAFVFRIFVTIKYLNEEPALSILHVAQHEVCHIHKGHLDFIRTGDASYVENDAEICVYKYVGEEVYLDYLRIVANTAPELRSLSREELKQRINKRMEEFKGTITW